MIVSDFLDVVVYIVSGFFSMLADMQVSNNVSMLGVFAAFAVLKVIIVFFVFGGIGNRSSEV